jgi:hypothetical protein
MPAMTLVLKTAAAPEGLPLMVKSIAASIDPKVFPYNRVLKADFHKNVQQVEQAAMAVSLLGIAALMLAAIGRLGLVAYTVSERTKEIAIRIALGRGRVMGWLRFYDSSFGPSPSGSSQEQSRCRSSCGGYCSESAIWIRPDTSVGSQF